jgi:hypothetical protein
MRRDLKRGLVLNRETIRVLSSQDMTHVGGGAANPPPFTAPKSGSCLPQPISKTCCACTHHC